MKRYVWLFTASALGVFAAPLQAQTKQPGVWAQNYTDRKPDPDIRFGQLPNGLRFAIQHNTTPPGQLAMRLYIGSGSLAETDRQQGLAHFVEHMAFRGSTNVSDGEMARILQRLGLALGADTNAATSHEATVYRFDFPKSDPTSLDTGLMLFDEIAERLTLDPKAIDVERGVVASEERLGDSPALRAARAQAAFTLAGQLAANRWPIGKPEVIAHASNTDLRAFYEAHYRPDNAVIVIVGDVDPAAVEAKIKGRFGSWQGRAVAPPDTGHVATQGLTARMFSEPQAPLGLQISWLHPYDERADTDARERSNWGRAFLQSILNQRLSDISRRANPPFLGAALVRSNAFHSAEIYSVVVAASIDRQPQALAAVEREVQRLLRFGVTQAEVDRTCGEFIANLMTAAQAQPTRTSVNIADKILSATAKDEVVRSPAQDYLQGQGEAPQVTITEVNAAAKAAFSGAGPLIFETAATPKLGQERALVNAYNMAADGTISVPSTNSALTWPYGSFGPPGQIAERHEIADLGLTIVSFNNGVHLTIKPTKLAMNQILVRVEFGQGRLGLPRKRERAYWMVNGSAPVFVEGGTGKLSLPEIARTLSGKIGSVTLSIRDDAYVLSGDTRSADFSFQMQGIMAFFSDPGFRPEAVARMKDGLATILPQADATPTAVARHNLDQLLHSNDKRWSTLPSAEDLSASSVEDLKALIQPALAGPVDVTIVGDVTVDQAIAQTAATFGTLSPRPKQPLISERINLLPGTPMPVVLYHKGRADQAMAIAIWPTLGMFENVRDARTLQVLAAVIRTRLFDRLRETDGITYSPGVTSYNDSVLPGYGYLLAQTELPPAKIESFYAILDMIVADLRANPVSADELARARQPLVDARRRDQESNEYWARTLQRAERDPAKLTAIRTRVNDIEAVTPERLLEAVRRYQAHSADRRIVVLPVMSTPTS